jgi:hypothetical protein
MTAIDRRDSIKKKRIMEISKAILNSMEYQKLLSVERRKQNAVDKEKTAKCREKLD